MCRVSCGPTLAQFSLSASPEWQATPLQEAAMMQEMHGNTKDGNDCFDPDGRDDCIMSRAMAGDGC